MPNLFDNLPATAGNGSGAAVDTTDYGKVRTVTVEGAFTGVVNIEGSLDGGTSWIQITTFSDSGEISFCIACNRMRVTRSGVDSQNPGLPDVEVGSNDVGGLYVPLPAPAGNGTAASTDISALGTFHTISVTGRYTGTCLIQISEDNIDWSQLAAFTASSGFLSQSFTAAFARVQRTGVDSQNPGLPVVNIGAINDAGANTGTVGTYSPPEKWGQNTVPAGQAATALLGTVSQLYETIEAIRPGSLIGISLRFTGTVTLGNATATVTINGVAQTLAVIVASGNSQNQTLQLAEIDNYIAGDFIGVSLATDGPFAPSGSLSCEVWLLVRDTP